MNYYNDSCIENITSFLDIHQIFPFLLQYDFHLPIKLTHIPNIFKHQITDEILQRHMFRQLTHLDASFNNKITDRGILALPHLQELDCSYNPNITGLSVGNLSCLTCLIAIENCHIQDQDLIHLPLQKLKIAINQQYTGSCLPHLKNLQELWMYNTSIEGKYLSSLKKLHTLNISHTTQVSLENIQDLNLKICIANDCHLTSDNKLKNGLSIINCISCKE